MRLMKCPRCDLNYIVGDEKYCKVCMREMKGDAPKDETELCSICNVEPAIPGRDVCIFCQQEMDSQNSGGSEGEEENGVSSPELTVMPSMSSMEEMPDMTDSDLPRDMAESLEQESLEQLREDEEEEDDEEEDED